MKNHYLLRLLLLVLCLLCVGLTAQAQCPTGGVTLSTQAEVNAFPAGCPNLPGTLTISGADITNLNSLSALTSVEGQLRILNNTSLTSVSGLSALRQVGTSLIIQNNAVLPNLSGLQSLTSVEGLLTIRDNAALTSISSLSALRQVGASLTIQNNAVLPNLSGLQSLTSVQNLLTIQDNAALTSISSLSALRQVGASLRIQNNAVLPNLSGLQSLTSVQNLLTIQDNAQLSLCATPPICRLLPTITGTITIRNNAPGCATRAEVEANCRGLTITDFAASPNPVCAGSPVTFTATVSNVVTPYSFTITNGASTSIATNSSNTALSQTLTASGSGPQPFTLTVSSPGGSATSVTTSVTVNAVTVTNPTVSDATEGQPFSQTFTASGGATPYRFRVEGGDSRLPTGLSLSESGILSGTPTQTGNFPIAVRATDASLVCEGSGTTYPLRVNPPVVQCPTGDVRLSTQAEVNAFPPGCSTVPGSLTISGIDITDLSPLASLTSVGANLIVNNNSLLTSMSGLNALRQVGGNLEIISNNALPNLSGLESLTSVRDLLTIYENESLTTVSSLSALQQVGVLDISINNALPNLSGLQSLTSVEGGLFILENLLLTSVSSLSGIRQVRGNIRIQGNSALADLSGLESLTGVGGELAIANNPSLTSVRGLSALRQVGEDLFIFSNDVLPSLSGFDALTSVASDVFIVDNAQLSTCSTEPICRLLPSITGAITIRNNAPGCDTRAEVEANCAGPTITSFGASPNPVCAGSPVTFTATLGNVVTPYSFTLTNGAGTSIATTSSTTALSQTLTASGTGPQPFTLTVSSGGQLTTATTSVTVNGAAPTRLYVNDDATGANTGLTWQDAFTDLQSALTFSCRQNLTEIWIARGVYKPRSGAVGDAFAMLPNVAIYGGFNGGETDLTQRPPITPENPSSTTLSADINNDNTVLGNSRYIIYNTLRLTSTAILDGAVITDPLSGTQTAAIMNNSSTDPRSGFGSECSPQFRNLLFTGYVTGQDFVSSSGLFVNNVAIEGSIASPSFVNCVFRANQGNPGNGASILNVTSSRPESSSATKISLQFTNCIFANNSAPQLINFTIRGSIQTQFTNCSFLNVPDGIAENRRSQVDPAIDIQLTNCVLWNTGGANTFRQDPSTSLSVTAQYSLLDQAITGYTSGPNNLTTTSSPFVSATNLRLLPCSPGIDAGLNSATGLNGITTDVDNNPRRFNNAGAPAGIVDMGAYEFQGTTSLTVTNPTVTTATQGVAFNQTFTAAGGTQPYSFSLASGSLPPGLSLATTGVLSGTPSQEGSYTLTVRATDASGCVGTGGVYSLTVTAPVVNQPTITGFAANPNPVCAGSPITFTATIGNVTGDYGWSISNGGPPVGSAGPSSATAFSTQLTAIGSGLQTFTLTVTSGGQVATATTTVTVDALPVAELTNNGPLTCNQTSVTLTASGGTSYSFSAGASQIGATNQAVVTTSGTYSVTVANATGCVSATSTTVESSTAAAQVSISPVSATLSCASPTVSLTALGTGDVRWSTTETTPVISVSVAGTYSVTITNASGCTATTSARVEQAPDQTIAFTQQPLSATSVTVGATVSTGVTVSGNPTSYQWYKDNLNNPLSGQTSASLTLANVQLSDAGTYSVVITGSCNSLTSTAFSLSVSSPVVETGPFAITAVTTLNCTPVLPNRFSISFTPRYSGLTGQPISFSVANELLPTTEPGPFTIRLYTDNPRITLKATQQGTPQEANFVYDWLAACQASESANTAPTVVLPVPPQSATVGVGYSYVIPEGTFTDAQTPGSLQVSARGLPPGLSLTGYTLSGVPSTTVGSPFTATLTATDPGGLAVSTSVLFSIAPGLSVPPAPSQPFAITGVSMLSCTPIADRININFAPQYVGLNGQAIAFEVVNELAATNEPAPYSLTLYRDNPRITLRARQTGSVGEASFVYDWLAGCASQGQDNTAPRLNSAVGSQTAVVGQSYVLSLANVFLDQETPQSLTLSASGLPAGLALVGSTISGTPSVTGVSTVVVRATDPGGLSLTVSFGLTVSAASSQTVTPPVGEPGSFTITGVQTLSCVVVNAGLRAVTFQPQYAGVTGPPISFRVVNELAATSQPGPYTLNLYTDNPAVLLRATQNGSAGEASFVYNWLAGCSGGSARQGVEAVAPLEVLVLGNPTPGDVVEVLVKGAGGQALSLRVVDERGRLMSERRVGGEESDQPQPVRLGQSAGRYLIQVSTPSQQRTVKVLKR
ncbi:putative Ig domain-containing protein [Spirosoma soli]|uniref:Ig domain-containing protein n=1 Tax=Spirosoma soli TaxID=1770529 RepID=A0ABW5M482_9BACT